MCTVLPLDCSFEIAISTYCTTTYYRSFLIEEEHDTHTHSCHACHSILRGEMISVGAGASAEDHALHLSLCCVCCHESHEQPQILGNFSLLPFGLLPDPGNKSFLELAPHLSVHLLNRNKVKHSPPLHPACGPL
jgi:hypothetical protein